MSLLSRLRPFSPIIVALSLPFILGSCATAGLLSAQAGALGALGRTKGAGAQNKFMDDQNRTVGQATAIGTGTGMVVAAAIGRRLGPLGSLAVIAGGAIAGNMLGQHVAIKKALAQQSSSNLDAAISEATKENANARKNLESMRNTPRRSQS